MPSELESIFLKLRTILQMYADGLLVTADGPSRYCLEGNVGPATLRAWSGKIRRPRIPVAWVEVQKSSVSYHLMGIYENKTLQRTLSKQLKARMTGKTCFNFKTADDLSLAKELEHVTARALAAFRTAGFISNAKSA